MMQPSSDPNTIRILDVILPEYELHTLQEISGLVVVPPGEIAALVLRY
jgi:hypothetical protein